MYSLIVEYAKVYRVSCVLFILSVLEIILFVLTIEESNQILIIFEYITTDILIVSSNL